MDPAVTAQLWNSLIGAGLPAVLMAVAVWHLNRTNSTLISELNKEREERLDAMQAHIEKLEIKSDSCEKDRVELHRQIAALLAREQQRG